MSTGSCWIGIASKDHVDMAVAGRFLQLHHGKGTPLERMRAGDCFAFYSPRTAHPNGEALQAFTAIGCVRTGNLYQASLSDDPRPYRIDVDYFVSESASIKPLIEQLSFINSKVHWGAAFRNGMRRVPPSDFAVIAAAMHCRLENIAAEACSLSAMG